MTHLLFIRPTDDSAAGHVATWGQAVRGLAGAFTTSDLYGLSQATRANVDTELPKAASMAVIGSLQ